MTDEQSLGGASTPFGNPNGSPAGVTLPPIQTVETVLDLDELMSQVRLVERTARICLRADLQAEYDEAVEELATLVDEHGVPLADGEDALSAVSRAQELADKVGELRAEMNKAMRFVRFRALPADKWDAFEKAHRDEQGAYKDVEQTNIDLISATAIAPKMTPEQVRNLRGGIAAPQFAELANQAFYACTTGGVDIPKLLPFSHVQRRDSSEKR